MAKYPISRSNPVSGRFRTVAESLKKAFVKTNFAKPHEISIFASNEYDGFGLYIRNNQIDGYIKIHAQPSVTPEMDATYKFTIKYLNGSHEVVENLFPEYLTNFIYGKKLVERDVKAFITKLEKHLLGFDFDLIDFDVPLDEEYEQCISPNLDRDRRMNPRKNPATGVLGAFILGGIIGHSMKK